MPRRRRPPRRPITDRGGALGRPLLLLATLLASACSQPTLPDLGTVPSFSLHDGEGATVTADSLRGHVWVANFIFTRCPDVCPALSARMKTLQDADATADPVRLVSFTVDPAHDTPDVLRDYARRVGAKPGWTFLTGPRAELAALFHDGFKVAFADEGPPERPITHSDRFVLVDRQLRIRGYYHGSDADDVARLRRDAAALRAEESS